MILSFLIPCSNSYLFQVVIWQAPPCLATHPMFPQLDKAATQPQLWQEWFLVSPGFDNGAHVFEQYTSFHRWLCYCFAAIEVYSFHKEYVRCQ